MKCRRVEILAAAVVLFLCTSPVLATIHFKDGGIHDIDYEINDDVWVDYESPGLETTLNILDGARIPYDYHVEGFEDSIINILGGSIYQFYAYDSSQVAISGGGIVDLYAYDSSQVVVSDVIVYFFFETAGSSQVAVSGGYIGDFWAHDSSQVAFSGGRMDWLSAGGSSQVTVSGGSIRDCLSAGGNSQVTVSGGSIGDQLRAGLAGILTIHGWDFAVDGMPVGYTELYSVFGGDYKDEPHRQLTGTLLSGDPLNSRFRIGDNGKIVLVPEPATLLLLGLGGLALLRKRRQEAF